LRKALKEIGENVGDEELQGLIAEVDINKNCILLRRRNFCRCGRRGRGGIGRIWRGIERDWHVGEAEEGIYVGRGRVKQR
jgi:hypothetical protein